MQSVQKRLRNHGEICYRFFQVLLPILRAVSICIGLGMDLYASQDSARGKGDNSACRHSILSRLLHMIKSARASVIAAAPSHLRRIPLRSPYMLAVHHREHVSSFRPSVLKLCSVPRAGGRLAWQDSSAETTVLTARIPTLAELPLAPGDLTIVLSGPSFAKKLE